MRPAIALVSEHFEALFHAYLWVNASALAAIVGEPALGAIGLVTVAPFLVAYACVARARRRARPLRLAVAVLYSPSRSPEARPRPWKSSFWAPARRSSPRAAARPRSP